jgi:hypothetical protein
MAQGAGYAGSFETRAEKDTRNKLDELFGRDGLGFLAVCTCSPILTRANGVRGQQAEERAVFMRSIAPDNGPHWMGRGDFRKFLIERPQDRVVCTAIRCPMEKEECAFQPSLEPSPA